MTANSKVETPPVVTEPMLAVTMSDLQQVANLLQRIILDGQEAQALLNRLAQARPVAAGE